MSGFISQKEIERSQRDCRKITEFLMTNGRSTFSDISMKCGINKLTLESRLAKLRRDNRVRYVGRSNSSHKTDSYYEYVYQFGELAKSMADYPKTYLSWGGYAA